MGIYICYYWPMRTIDFGSKVEGKGQGAFVIFYALDGRPWLDYEGAGRRRELTIPTCLMINRADGRIGFIGGMVEAGETLEGTAIREVEEEIGHAITTELEPIVAHDIGSFTTYAFAAQMSYTQLRAMQIEATKAPHFGSEVTGVFLPHLIDYEQTIDEAGGIQDLLAGSMATSVREELVHFLLKKRLFSNEQLDAICKKAGYSLEALLI
jgi:8-oxo-dGTP pyrophosphatase MutT (NUDIX family)